MKTYFSKLFDGLSSKGTLPSKVFLLLNRNGAWQKWEAQYASKNYRDAVRYLSEAIRIDPSHVRAYIGRGNNHYMLHQYDIGERKPAGQANLP